MKVVDLPRPALVPYHTHQPDALVEGRTVVLALQRKDCFTWLPGVIQQDAFLHGTSPLTGEPPEKRLAFLHCSKDRPTYNPCRNRVKTCRVARNILRRSLATTSKWKRQTERPCLKRPQVVGDAFWSARASLACQHLVELLAVWGRYQ